MEVTLTAEAGRATGSRASNRLRAEGKVPAVVYGHGMDPVSFAIARRDLRVALTTEAGSNALINLEIGSDIHLAIVRDIQRDPVRNEVAHVDFVVVNRNEAITVDVPIVLEGEAEQVRREQGVVEQAMFSIPVSTTPTNIPSNFTVRISDLTVGDTVRVADLDLPSGVTTEVDPDDPVVVAQVSRATIEAEALEAEAEEAAEAAATEAAEEAAAEGDAVPGAGGQATEGGGAENVGE